MNNVEMSIPEIKERLVNVKSLTSDKKTEQRMNTLISDLSYWFAEGDKIYNKKIIDKINNVNSGIPSAKVDYNWVLELSEQLQKERDKKQGKWKEIDNTYDEMQAHFTTDYKNRRVLKGFFIATIVVAVLVAVVAIIGQFCWKGNDCYEIAIACFGIFDFAMGIIAFSFERINDMKTQTVSRLMVELDNAKAADDVERVEKVVNTFQNVKGNDNQVNNHSGCSFFNRQINKK